ncbi:cytochrome c-type biogenesis protein CcmH, partial [candidate division KSB1 bacterium]|nr:cytochrome c-type biogenesis protein CcmH [candidate division KSB1 bacterium]
MKELQIKAVIFLLVAVPAVLLSALESDGSDDLQSLQKEIEHSLVAPCCWNMTVDQHESPASHKVRDKIAELLEQGKTKEEILTYFTAQPEYGERILAAPSQKTFLGKMAYWLIPIVFIFGGLIAVKTIKNLSKVKSTKPAQHENIDNKPSGNKWEQKVEDELS